MKGPFRIASDEISLTVGSAEREALRSVPGLLDIGGDAGGRLDYTPHPDSPDADANYRALIGEDLERLRGEDRKAFDRIVGGAPVSPDEIEAFMRVVGEARLVLANQLGIEDDGWELEVDVNSDPEMAMLGWLGYLQDAAVHVLSERF